MGLSEANLTRASTRAKNTAEAKTSTPPIAPSTSYRTCHRVQTSPATNATSAAGTTFSPRRRPSSTLDVGREKRTSSDRPTSAHVLASRRVPAAALAKKVSLSTVPGSR